MAVRVRRNILCNESYLPHLSETYTLYFNEDFICDWLGEYEDFAFLDILSCDYPNRADYEDFW